jgi:hypothetical protein
MKKLLVLSAVAAVATLTACAGPYYREYAGGYDGYYDGYYGAYPGGHWSTDGYFYYGDGHGNYRRDDDRHFRREGYSFYSDRDRRD